MEHLRILEKPQLRHPIFLGAFIGWADAQEAASGAVRYFRRHLTATKFAELDPEEFYDFTLVRPFVYNDREGNRQIRWPRNDFFYWRNPDGPQDLILFIGTQPNLKWRTYTQALLSAVQDLDLDLVVNLGTLLDALPHTREPVINGSVSREELKPRLQGLQLRHFNQYEGPAGITSAWMETCVKAGLSYASIWGHAPHYVQQSPNWKVARALVAQVNHLFQIPADLDELDKHGQVFETEVTRTIAANVEASAYVKRLERQYDEAMGAKQQEQPEAPELQGSEGLPTAQTMVEELEKFLRRDLPGQQPPNISHN